MNYEFITVDRDGPITTITLNRPQSRNALHPPAHWECHHALDAFEADSDQWVAIITGAGDQSFCAGNDLKFQASGVTPVLPSSGFAGLTARTNNVKPVIAAVNGYALGGGFEIALACDILLAAETASFSLPEARIGMAALAGGLHRLPRAIGPRRAMQMIMTCERVSAQQGLELGFVNDVIGEEGVLPAAKRWAREICKASPLAIQAAKQAMQHGLDRPIADAMIAQWGCQAMRDLRTSQDWVEGPRAFAEKRAPVWTGR
ncbi:enoyl-CoA hydratase-related protein [Sphingopyxis yananensis]|uniref:enoyl-CoA hydratase-related protein n=1 Tax=Sphingopyxis yananensis TaxID=2886687 RepID=UPI001D0FE8A9|nr:enoyl-CoA hydratase-related protein [Sphingopyxis yananensis]MCC2602392.1 enoyl-CoA hydratase/isomerase family protein [Sphingopyxis yananensis]